MPAFLENVVSSALNNALGAYFYGIESQKLKVDVFRGQVVLQNLPVREDALAAFQLPYKIRWGVVGTLKLNVPWQKLGREPVDVVIDEAFVLVVPITLLLRDGLVLVQLAIHDRRASVTIWVRAIHVIIACHLLVAFGEKLA